MSVDPGSIGNLLAENVLDEMEKLGKVRSLEGKSTFDVISNSNQMAEMMEMMTSGIDSDASSESSAADSAERSGRCKTRSKISKDKTPNRLNERKIHNHKDDRPGFDSYNVFNRQLPLKNTFANADNDFGIPSRNRIELGGGDGPDEAPDDVAEGNSEASRGPYHRKSSLKARKFSANSEKIHSDEIQTIKAKRQNAMKSLRRTKHLTPKIHSAKKPVSRSLAREIARQAAKYLEALKALATKDLNSDKHETTKLELNADEDSGCDDHEGSIINDTEDTKLALFKTISEIRSQSATSDVFWNCGLLFVDQGLAYNRMAQTNRAWVNDKGLVVTDLSDPATDAVRLVGLSMGGVIVPKSWCNPYDYTNSYVEAMIEKYPVLCPENKTGPQYYELALNKVAEMFPVLLTTHYMLMGDPQLGTMAKLEYGLPLAIYLEGFPSLVCQHLLEKDYNILPFLMTNMIIRLGPLFKEANPAGRLEMAKIAWKHLKKSIDSSSLPWYFRELFCRKYSICKDPDFYPAHRREREKAMMDLAALVGHAEVSSLLAQIDEYDFRKECPSANGLQPTNWDMYYMNVFYSRAVKHLQVDHKPVETMNGPSRNNHHNLNAADCTEEIENEEIRQILETTNRLVEGPQPNEDHENPKNRWFINLDEGID